METMHEGWQEQQHQSHQGHYLKLLMMSVLSFAAMYGLMYAMVDSLDNVFNNLNQFYMAGLMTMPMVIFELMLMGRMYPDRKSNLLIITACLVGLVVFWIAIRQQAGITDRQFLRSMIPHHGGAILMCERNPLQDPDLQQLCREIVVSQRSEIARMKAQLQEDGS